MIEKALNKNYIISVIMPFFKEKDIQAYIVGGFIRDCFLNRKSSDIDIVTDKGKAENAAKMLSDAINGYFVELDEINKIYRVVFADKTNYVDIADCTGMDIKEDLLRRDFTINALAYDINRACLVDVVGGVDDIKAGVIREISEENILDDSIRILRAFRFKSTLGFELSDKLKLIAANHSKELLTTAKERINIELVKLFGGKNVVEALELLNKFNILELIFPEVVEMRKVPKNSHHHLNLLEHSIETVRQVQIFYENACNEVKLHCDDIMFGGQSRMSYLKIAAFLHDVGKPSTWQIEPETGRHRFIMHDVEGAKIIAGTLKNLKFSKKQCAYIQKIIKNHIYPAGVVMSEDVGDKAYMRFYRKMENDVIDLIAVAYADRMSALGPEITQAMIDKNINGLDKLLQMYLEQKNKMKPLPKLLNGNEIMQLLNIPASKKLGQIISKLYEAQLSGEINTKEEAVWFVKSINL